MLLSSVQEDDYVIKVDEAVYQILLSWAILHQLLEYGGSNANPKRHAISLKKP